MATEKRLIDAKGKFVLNAGDLTGNIMCFENGYATVFDRFAKVICKFSILDAPTVDAVEVVRCKDCRWRNTRGCPYMNFNAVPRDDLDFCGDGERRERYI